MVTDSAGEAISLRRGEAGMAGADAVIRAQLRGLHPDRGFPNGVPPRALSPFDVKRTVYCGTARAPGGPLRGATTGVAQPFTAQFRFQVEGRPFVPYPVGWWTPDADGVTAARGGAANFVAIRYDGGDVYAVLSPPPGGAARLWILSDDGWLPRGSLGEDARLDARGAAYVDVTEPRLYWIARSSGRHVLKLSPDQAGVTLHAAIIELNAGRAGAD
jgi:hypothetical protein